MSQVENETRLLHRTCFVLIAVNELARVFYAIYQSGTVSFYSAQVCHFSLEFTTVLEFDIFCLSIYQVVDMVDMLSVLHHGLITMIAV